MSRLSEGKVTMLKNLQPWEALMKRIVWLQLGEISNKKILDFGSGIGVTADYLAGNNEVIAIEPSEESVDIRWTNNEDDCYDDDCHRGNCKSKSRCCIKCPSGQLGPKLKNCA